MREHRGGRSQLPLLGGCLVAIAFLVLLRQLLTPLPEPPVAPAAQYLYREDDDDLLVRRTPRPPRTATD